MSKKKIHKFEHNKPVRGYSSYRERKAKAEHIRDSVVLCFKVAALALVIYTLLPILYQYL